MIIRKRNAMDRKSRGKHKEYPPYLCQQNNFISLHGLNLKPDTRQHEQAQSSNDKEKQHTSVQDHRYRGYNLTTIRGILVQVNPIYHIVSMQVEGGRISFQPGRGHSGSMRLGSQLRRALHSRVSRSKGAAGWGKPRRGGVLGFEIEKPTDRCGGRGRREEAMEPLIINIPISKVDLEEARLVRRVPSPTAYGPAPGSRKAQVSPG
jgi:hypothetical protein